MTEEMVTVLKIETTEMWKFLSVSKTPSVNSKSKKLTEMITMDCGMFYLLVNAMIREAGDADGRDGAKRGEKGKLSPYQTLPKFPGL